MSNNYEIAYITPLIDGKKIKMLFDSCQREWILEPVSIDISTENYDRKFITYKICNYTDPIKKVLFDERQIENTKH